jgi:[ribosomal protein S5]-alanine N-acetyltransferase
MVLPAVRLRAPSTEDRRAFLKAVKQSRSLHHPWVYPPSSVRAFETFLERIARPTHSSHLIVDVPTGGIAGIANLSEIVRGSFQSAYLGFFAFAGWENQGYMQHGLQLVCAHAFRHLRLHRIEANIQPANLRSRALVRRLGFRCEGLSRRYLKIGGRWRDHERWALLIEDWKEAFSR